MNRPGSSRGFALVELLIVLTLLSAAGVAAVVVGHATARQARLAQLTGRQASVAIQLVGRVRAGLLTADSGAVRLTVNGESFEAMYVHRDDLLPGAIEIRVMAGPGSRALHLVAPALAP